MYTKLLFSIRKRHFSTCIFLIFGSTESASPNAAAKAYNNLEKSRATHGWNLYHILTVVHFGCCSSSLSSAKLCSVKITAMCTSDSDWQGCDPHRLIIFLWRLGARVGCNWFKGCNASAPGQCWTVPWWFLYLRNPSVQWICSMTYSS